MKLLLDTHVLLRALSDDPALRPAHRDAIATGEVYLSAASVWEIGVKRELGKFDVPGDLFEVAARNGCRSLPITWRHAEVAAALPPHHGDPFDRMLIGQACCEGLAILSADRMFQRYEVEVII